LHGAYSHNPRINRLIGFTFDLLGANSYMWKITHNVIHHTYTNIHGIDEDLAVSPMIRLSAALGVASDSPRAALARLRPVQLLHAVLGLREGLQVFLPADLGPYKDKKHPASEWAILVVGKLFYYSWAIVVPLLVITVVPWWQVLIGYVAMNATAGLILGVVFQLAHVVEGPEHPAPDCHGCMCDAWAVHQLQTTSNFATGKPVAVVVRGWPQLSGSSTTCFRGPAACTTPRSPRSSATSPASMACRTTSSRRCGRRSARTTTPSRSTRTRRTCWRS